MKNPTRICIVGASFGGLSAVLQLRKRLGDSVEIALFDIQEQFTYIPGLHETILDTNSLGGLQFDLSKYYPEYIKAEIMSIQSHQIISCEGTAYKFDYCIIATGSRTKFHDDVQRNHAYTVSSPDDIPQLNNKLSDANTQTITVIGGGYTGIEIASIIAQRKRSDQVLRVIHSRDRLFDRLSEYISLTCQLWLAKLQVDIIFNTRIDQIQSDHIITQDGTRIDSDCTIIAWGITTNDEVFDDHLSFDRGYQPVDKDHIYLCGDVAAHGLVSTAHNAMFEGRRMGDMVADQITGEIRDYPALANWDKLAIALGVHDGIFTNGHKGIYIPYLIGLAKKIIQYRVMIEFKYRIMLPV